MIVLDKVTKTYPSKAGPRKILDAVSFKIERGQRMGILGANGAGKSTLIRILSGAEKPDSGTITRGMTVSWPLAFTGGFQTALTGLDNLRFICRVYGVDFNDRLAFVKQFSELGPALNEPLRTYSSGMRAKLAFAISLSIDFDCFLIDEVVAVGDARFQEKCRLELFEKDNARSIILVSHFPGYIQSHCSSACVLSGGHLYEFRDVNAAVEFYNATQLPI